jgi:hypothetical protein
LINRTPLVSAETTCGFRLVRVVLDARESKVFEGAIEAGGMPNP